MHTDLLPRWVRANGLDLAYLTQGEGPLLVLLHGFPDTAWSFAPLLPRFARAGYRVAAPFLRGYAPSSLPADGDYRVTALASDLTALIRALGEQQADVVGHDWGAATVYTAATREPQRFRRIVTAAVPHPRRFPLRPSLAQLYRSRYMGFFQLRGIAERRVTADDFASLRALIRRWSPGWHFTEGDFAPLRAAFRDPARLAAALGYYRALPATLADRENLRLLFRPVPVPALVIRGRDDGCIGAEMFEDQAQYFAAGYRLATLEGAGHFMHCEKPAEFADLVLGFLRE